MAAIALNIHDNARLKMTSEVVILEPVFQSEVVQLWLQDQPQRQSDYSEETLNGFKNIGWIKFNSNGEFLMDSLESFL